MDQPVLNTVLHIVVIVIATILVAAIVGIIVMMIQVYTIACTRVYDLDISTKCLDKDRLLTVVLPTQLAYYRIMIRAHCLHL